MKNVSLVVMTNGRIEYLEATLESFKINISYYWLDKTIFNDSIDEGLKEATDNLARSYGYEVFHNPWPMGFSGTYSNAWQRINDKADFVFSTEDDFILHERLDVEKMISILEHDRNLVQLALKRQPWNPHEARMGGIVEASPKDFTEVSANNLKWTEHRKFFTTNPSLIPSWVIQRGWPDEPHSEGKFALKLFENPNYKSAYLGGKFDPPKVEHIGKVRTGINY